MTLKLKRAPRALRWAFGAAAVLLVAVVLVLVAHTPPARRAVLRRAIATLEERFDLVLEARALRYNLLTRRVTLEGVRLAAADSAGLPFLTAETIEIAVPRSALFGPFALEYVRAGNARLDLIRRADGTTNLPAGDAGADTVTPSALAIDHIDIPRLALTLADASSGVTLALPLAVDVRPDRGTIRLTGPGSARRDDVATTIAAMQGGVAFDGRTVHLSRFALATDEASLTIDGSVALLVDDPRMDLRLSGTGDIGPLARWGMDAPRPAGTFAFDGTVGGPFTAPVVTANVNDGTVTWEGLTVSDVTGYLDLNPERLAVSRVGATLAGGRVTGAAGLAFATREADATASWRDVDTRALVRVAVPSATVTPAARATGTASFRGTPADMAAWAVDLTTQLEPVRAARGELSVSGGARLHVASGTWRVDAAPAVAGTPFRMQLQGRLDTERLPASTLQGTIGLLPSDLPRLLRTLQTAGLVSIQDDVVGAGTLDADVALSGTFERPRAQITARARGLEAGGLAGLDLDLTASGTAERMAVETRVRQGAANVAYASGTVWPTDERLDARITGTLREPGRLVPDVPIDGTVDVQADARGAFDALTALGTIAVDEARYANLRLGRLDATFAVDADAAQMVLASDEFAARATGRVARDAQRRVAIDLEVDEANLERMVRDAALPVAVSGRVSLRAHGEGSLTDWRRGTGSLDVSRIEALVGGLPIRLIDPARLTYSDATLGVERLDAAVGETRVSVTGRLPLFDAAPGVAPTDALQGIVAGDLAQVLTAVRATGLTGLPDIAAAGPVALLVRITGSGERPVLAADLDTGPAQVTFADVPPVDRLQLRAHLEDGWLNVLTAQGEWQGSAFAAEGRAPLRLLDTYLPSAVATTMLGAAEGPAVLRARVQSITARVLAPFLDADTLAQIDGAIDASADLTAPTTDLDDLQGEVRLDRLDVRVADLPIAQREPTRVTFDRGFARVAAWDWIGQGATLAVEGQVRLADRSSAIRAGGQIDLRMLAPFLRDAGMTTTGTLTPRVAITGPLGEPRINAEVILADGGLRLADPRVIATGLSAKAVVSQIGATVTDVAGTINGGTLTGSGRADWKPDEAFGARLGIDVSGMALDFPEGLRSELNAQLELALTGGAADPRGNLTGTVTVVRSAYREPIAVVTGLLAALRTERLVAAASASESFTDRLTLDVRVVTDTDVIVDNNVARLQLGGDLRVIGTAAAPALSGRATLREGGELFLGRNRYSIDSGTIDFENPAIVEPDLNVQARTRVGGEEIELTLKGTPETLDVELQAPGTDLGQSDIASLLLTGRRLSDVSGAEAEIVGEQVLSYLSGDVLGVASRVVGLDTIRLGGADQSTLRRDPAAIATEADPTSRLTFGKSLGETLEITLSQSLREGDAQTWIVDYQPLSQLGLRLISRDDHLRTYEFRHDVSLGSTAPATRATPREQAREGKVAEVRFVNAACPDGGAGDCAAGAVPFETQLRGALGLNPGDTFDFTEWQRDRDRIEQVLQRAGRREARVTADRREQASGVVLSYRVEAGPTTAIAIDGFDLSSAARQALESAWAQSVFDDFLEDEAEAIVRRALADEGYFQPTVAADLSTGIEGGPEGAPRQAKTLTITIAPGERTVERRIVIDADDDAVSRELEQWIEDQRLTDQGWRDPASLERAVTSHLQTRGYVNARAAAAAPVLDGRQAAMTVTVEAGPAFLVRTVRFTGASRVDAAALADAAGLEPGSTYVPGRVEDGRGRVMALYRRDGFVDVRVAVQPAVDPAAARIDIVFAVEEGPRQVLQEITVVGNRSIDTDVITRALDLTVGEPLGADAWLQARSRLFDTALFRRVDVVATPIADAVPGEADRPVRVRATVQEWPALRLRYGFQLSEERPEAELEGRDLVPGLSADVTRRTLFGRAVTVGGVGEYQRRERLARVFANAPTLFGLPVESLLASHRSHEEFADATLVTDRTGVSWEQRMRLASALRVSYSYVFDRDHTFDTDPPPGFPAFDVTAHVARLTAAAVWDTRDDPIDTARGLMLSTNLEYAADGLGSDVSFVRHLSQAYYFRPWRQIVFASAARVGTVTALEGQSVITSELFLGGGARTVRGVPDDGLGPRDFTGSAAGGGAVFIVNQEARFPIFRWVRGVGFLDAGNVFTTPSALDLGRLVGSVGAGLRVTTPFALLRVDYGKVFAGTAADAPGGRWTFGIGHTF